MFNPKPTTIRVNRRVAIGAGITGFAAAQAAPAFALAQGATPAAASGSGISPDSIARALDALDDIVTGAMNRTGVPGVATSVVHQNAVVAARGYGVASTATGAPVDADTIFQLASLSKPIASTVVAGIVGDGHVSWDTRIVEHLPWFALHDLYPTGEVTIRDMFSHRSGLPEHAGDLLEDIGYDRDDVLHRLRYLQPEYSFRAGYAYTNFGLTAGAVAASTAAGQTWEDASDIRLYQPAGMTRTSSRFDAFISADNHAATHVRIDGAWTPEYVRDPDAQSPAGGVSSTAADMAQWMRLQLGGGMLDGDTIIDVAALAETHSPHSINTPKGQPAGFYGLGWNVNLDPEGLRLSHSGAFALGAGTTVYLFPDDGFGITVLTNGYPIGLAESIALAFVDVVRTGTVRHDYLDLLTPVFADIAAPQYGKGVANDPPLSALPPRDPASYTGTYHNRVYGPIEIAQDGDGLTLSQGPVADPDVYPLTHWDRDTFTYLPIGENANVTSAVTFTIGPDGLASHVIVESLDLHHHGTFSRNAAPVT